MYSLVLMAALSNGATAPSFNEVPPAAEPVALGLHAHHQDRHRRRGCGCHGGGGGCHGGMGYSSYGCHGGTVYGGYGYSDGYYTSAPMGGPYYGEMPLAMPAEERYSDEYRRSREPSGYYDDRDRRDRDTAPADRNRNDRNRPGTSQPNDTSRPASERSQAAAPATLVVSLPPDARLQIDGTPTQSTSDLRTFVSPPLDPGQTYHYDLTAELRDNTGQVRKTHKQVTVRAGEETRVALDFKNANPSAR